VAFCFGYLVQHATKALEGVLAYYLRLFSKSTARVSIDRLSARLKARGAGPVRLEPEGDDGEMWDDILAVTTDGRNICTLERNTPSDEIFTVEIDEIIEILKAQFPTSGANWVKAYLAEVKSIFAARYLSAGFEDGDHPSPADILWAIAAEIGGILQADGEGFTNEDGYTVVWQFDDNAKGPWGVAILGPDSAWQTATVDLENREHRTAFLAGNLPT
jgi:hypothetical protein